MCLLIANESADMGGGGVYARYITIYVLFFLFVKCSLETRFGDSAEIPPGERSGEVGMSPSPAPPPFYYMFSFIQAKLALVRLFMQFKKTAILSLLRVFTVSAR